MPSARHVTVTCRGDFTMGSPSSPAWRQLGLFWYRSVHVPAHGGKRAMWKVWAGMALGIFVIPATTVADMSIHRHDGTTGTVHDFGGIRIYQDSHGTTDPSHRFTGTSPSQF